MRFASKTKKILKYQDECLNNMEEDRSPPIGAIRALGELSPSRAVSIIRVAWRASLLSEDDALTLISELSKVENL